MRRISIFFAAVVMLITLATSVSAQTGRVLGARRLQMDDGTATLGGLVWLTDQGGSLGVDLNGNVSGSFPSTCALLDVSSTTKGFLLPRMSNAQELAICGGLPPEGLLVYNLTNHTLDVFNGSAWGPIAGWTLRGNTIASGGTPLGGSYIGTNNAQDFVMATNGTERARINAAGQTGIGGAPNAAWALTVGTVGSNSTLNSGAETVQGLFTANGGANIDNLAGAFPTNIGNTANTSAVTIASNANPTAITLNVTSVANNLVFNNIASDALPSQWLTLNASNQVRVTPLGSIAEQGVSYELEGGNLRFRLGGQNPGTGVNTVPFTSDRYINTNANTLHVTQGAGGTDFATFNGGTGAIALNNNVADVGTTSIGNTTGGGIVSISTSGTGTSATAVNVLGPTNINTTGSYSLTTIGNGATSNTQLTVNGGGGPGDLVGPAPYTNGPNNGWDLYVIGDEQVTGIIKSGTASIVIDGSVSGANNIIGAWTNNLTLASNTNTKDMVFQTNNGAENTVLTAKSAGNLDIPVTTAGLGLGTISQNGNRLIHTYNGVKNFYAGTNAGNYTLTGVDNTGVGNNALISLTTGSGNIALGNGSLFTNASGNNNTAAGMNALTFNLASQNTAFGWSSLFNNTNGSSNAAFGTGALIANITGSNNSAIGSSAGQTNVAGNNNTFVGASADANGNNYSFATAIGSNAIVGQNSSIILGRVGSDRVGVGTITPTATVDIVGATNLNADAASTGLTTMGAGTSQRWFNINGVADAIATDATGSAHWDVNLTGDMFVSGMLKSATSIVTGLVTGQVVFPDVNSQLSGNPQLFWNNPSNILLVGTSTTNGVANKLQVTSNDAAASGDAHQIIITGATTTTQMLELGYNTTANNGTIQSINQGFGPTNLLIQPVATGRTLIGSAGASLLSRLEVIGDGGGDVQGAAPYTNGPDNGWDLWVNGDAQVTGVLKAGTASMIIDGSVMGANNIIGAWTNNLTIASNTNTKDIVFQTNNGVENTVLTAKSAGNLDIPATVTPMGLGTISQNGTRIIHSFGTNNFFAGANAGNYTLTVINAFGNVGVGTSALSALTTGQFNTALGNNTLINTTTGIQNVAVGASSLAANTSGTANAAFGYLALPSNTSGNVNSAIGPQALNANTSGSNNSAVGYIAGATNTTGSNNTFIGQGADANAGAYTNATAIGSGTIVGQSNSIVLGRVGTDKIGIGTITPTAFLDVLGNINLNADAGSTGLTTLGAGTSQRWLNIVGVADALANTISTSALWDVNLTGDMFVSGMSSSLNATITSLTQGSVVFAGASGQLSQNNTNFFWNSALPGLGLGTNTVTHMLEVLGTSNLTGATTINTSGSALTTIGNTTTGGNVQLNTAAANTIALNGTTNINIGATYALTTVGNGTSHHQLVVSGLQDATGAEAFASPVWDLAVTGDIAATGMIKSGASLVMDGFSPIRRLISDNALTVSTDLAGAGTGGNLTMSTSGNGALINVVTSGNGGNISIGSTGAGTGNVDISTVNTGNISLETKGGGNLSVGPNTAGGTVSLSNNGANPVTISTSTGTLTIQSSGGTMNIQNTTANIATTTTTGNMTFNSTTGSTQIGTSLTVGALGTPNTTLDNRGSMSWHNVLTNLAANYTSGALDHVIICTNAAAGVVNLPAATNGRVIVIKAAGAGNVTVNQGATNIDNNGANLVIIGGGNTVRTFIADGTNWWIIGN